MSARRLSMEISTTFQGPTGGADATEVRGLAIADEEALGEAGPVE